MAVTLATIAQAAPVPFTGTLVLDLSPSGGNVLSVPGGGVATVNQASNVVWPITRFFVPLDAFRGTAGTGLIPGPFGATVRVVGELLNRSFSLRTTFTCTGTHPKVSCPGVGLAHSNGAIVGYTPPHRWSMPGIYATPYGASPVVISTPVIGAASSRSATGLFAAPSGTGVRTLSIQKGGWTTGRVRVFGSNSGTSFFVRNFSGSQGANSLSIVSPVAVTVVSPLAGIVRTSAVVARMTMNLSLSCGDGLISMGEICDDENTTPGDGCDASCQVEPGYDCTGAPSVCVLPVGIAGTKLIVVDKLTAASKAKIVYVAKDAGVQKGTTNDPAQISATLDYQMPTLGASGSAAMPQGGLWVVNRSSVAKYVNRNAPTGGAVKVGVIKPGKLLKAVLKDLGDGGSTIDVYQGGAATSPVTAATQFTVRDGPTTVKHCGEFTDCVRRIIAGGTGAKVVCKTAVDGGAVVCP